LQFEAGLRPRRLADFTGQTKLKENLGIIGEELEVAFTSTSGPVLQKKLDLTGIFSNIGARQVFFIDEIHRLLPDVEEMLYAALEDFRVDTLVGAGPGAPFSRAFSCWRNPLALFWRKEARL
jgi:Holliday junction DNA helicase RuvB